MCKPQTEEIKRLAYRRWEEAGKPQNLDAEFWLLAERELENDSFIHQAWLEVFAALKWFSVFQIVRRVFPRAANTYRFVDAWIILNFIAAALVWLGTSPASSSFFNQLLLFYGVFRVVELVVYNVAVLLSVSGDHSLRSFRRSVILSIHNYIEVLFWFAAFFRFFADQFGCKADIVSTIHGSLYFSAVTMATVGYGDIVPQDSLSRWIVFVHIGISLFLTLIVLSRFVSMLPVPKTLDSSERTT